MKLFDIAKIKKSKWLELGGKLVTRIVEDADNGIVKMVQVIQGTSLHIALNMLLKKQKEKQQEKALAQADKLVLLI